MKIQSTVRCTVLAKNEQKSQDGKNTYYNIAVLIGTEAGNLKCTESAYNEAMVGVLSDFIAEYNDSYNTFRLVAYKGAVNNAPKQATATTPTTK